MAYSNYVKNVLLDLINEMNSDPTPYVKNPQKNFTRKRKLDFGMVMKTII